MTETWTQGQLEFAVISDGTTEAMPIENLLVDPAEAAVLGVKEMPGTYHCLLIRGGSELVLIDTGWGPGARSVGLGRVLESLADVGVRAEDVTHVLTTHVHGDHIGYHAPEGAPAFPNARYVASRADIEWLQGRQDDRASVMRAMLEPVLDGLLYVEETSLPLGIEAVAAVGHTPGHHAFRVDGVLNVGDVILVEGWLAHPDVKLSLDADHERAARTRREVFARAAATGDTVVAFHLPQPVGRIVSDGDGWRWIPNG